MAFDKAKMKRGLRRKSAEIRSAKGRRLRIQKRKKRTKHNSRRRSVLAMPVKILYVDIVLCFSSLMLNASMEITGERNSEIFEEEERGGRIMRAFNL